MSDDVSITIGFLISIAFYIFLPFYLNYLETKSDKNNKKEKK